MDDATTCCIDSCYKPRYQQRKMCSTHVMRKHRYGDPLVDRSRTGRVWKSANGYLKRFVGHEHPLADAKGCTFIHREILYGAIGPGPHPCHWCAASVDWVRWVNGTSWDGVLVVDHLDGDKGNNARANLAPSCYSCNVLRARWSDASVVGRAARLPGC